MQAIRQKYFDPAAVTEAQLQRNKEKIERSHAIINHLRKENKKIRDKNEALRSAMDQLMGENKMLEEQSLKYRQVKGQVNGMVKVNAENETIVGLLAEMEDRKVFFETAIASRDDRIMFEVRVGRLYLNIIQAIVLCLEDKCDDEDLVFLVEELCLQVGHGIGLEETERDVSVSEM